MTVTYMRFTITGEYITQQARNFWTVDEQPERAIELLEEVEGLSTAQILDILEGRSKLAGDSTKGITLEPDTATGLSLKQTLRKLAKAQREAREDAADYAQMLNGDTACVSSPTGMREVPYRQTTSSLRGLPRQLKNGLDWKEAENPGTREPRVYRDVKTHRSLVDSRVFIEPEDPPSSDYIDDPPPPPVPEGDDKITSDTGWLSPAGEFYGCRYGQHNNTAYDLGFSTETLDKSGWVRVQMNHGAQMFFRYEYENVPLAQRHAIEDYCRKEKIETPWWLTIGDEDAHTD